MGYVVDGEVDLDAINAQCERAKRSWITEQEKLLSAIRGGRHYPFVPWKKGQVLGSGVSVFESGVSFMAVV